MTPRLTLVVVRCSDIHLSAEFYRCLGLEFDLHRHGSGAEHYASEMDGTVFELYPATEVQPASHSTRIGITVDSCDNVASRLIASGFQLSSPPAASPWGRRAVAVDPDRRKVDIFEAGARQD